LRILLHTRFYPNIGGIETVAALLTNEWVAMGQALTVVSDVACRPEQKHEFPFPIIYRPHWREFTRLLREHDVFVHFNVSLKVLYPLLFVRRPWIPVHHGFYTIDREGKRDWRERLKLWLARRASANIAVSEAVVRATELPCTVIPNPYNDCLFHSKNDASRDRDLVFVGRLVSDKGADLLVSAVGVLRKQGLQPKLTIIGDGPERAPLERQVRELALSDQVVFAGAQPQKKLAELLRQHEIMVVPSLWQEPFGVVALEGAACGCVVLGSDGGGLPEAIGPAGLTFRRGDAADLAVKLAHLLTHREEWPQYCQSAAGHLAKHQPRQVAMRYLEVIEKVVRDEFRK